MLPDLEKLLVLQDRDRKILRTREEFAHIAADRDQLKTLTTATQTQLDAAKTRAKQLESDRKKLELDVEAKKGQIERYAQQQLQTKKNEEYRALAHEIEMCKEVISKIEDQELELMEKGEAAAKQVAGASQAAAEAKKTSESRLAEIARREEDLKKELAALEENRSELAGAVDESLRARYERLFKAKGGNVVVGIQHGVCGGCHMKLTAQVVVACQGEQGVNSCPNCGRLLYFTPDMDLAVAD